MARHRSLRTLSALVAAVVFLILFVRYWRTRWWSGWRGRRNCSSSSASGGPPPPPSVADAAGLGKELGGLVAGVSLGSTAHRDMISARLASLRDFLLLFFFLSIGAALDLSTLGSHLGSAAVFSLFVLIGNPLIVVGIMAWMGYRARTGFLAGLTVAQISEFSLIFIAMGVSLGHVDQSAVGLVTLVGLVTIATSVYMITYSQALYRWARPLLAPFDFGRRPEGPGESTGARPTDVILFGLGRFGGELLVKLEDAGLQVLGIDADPQAVRAWRRKGYHVRFGDATEQEFWNDLPLGQARWIVMAVPYGTLLLSETDARSGLLAALRSHRFNGRIAITARDEAEGRRLGEGGVDLVLYPFVAAASAAVKEIADLEADVVDVDNQKEGEVA